MTRGIATTTATIVAVVLAMFGCAGSTKKAGAPINKATPADVASTEMVVSGLAHAHLKPRIAPPSKTAAFAKSDVVAGIFVLPPDRCRPQPTMTTLGGIQTRESDGIPLHDLPNAGAAYCLASFKSGETDFDRVGSFTADIMGEGGSWVRADRIERGAGAGSPASFHVWTLWADDVGRLQRLDEAQVPLTRLASFAGVEVFAFIDDDGVSTKGKPAVDVVIQRPPLTHWRVHMASFLIDNNDAQQKAASCSHAWMSLPLDKGNGSAASALVAIETEMGVRALRVNVSSLWLASQPHARITTRLQWAGEEVETINLQRRLEERDRSRSPINDRD